MSVVRALSGGGLAAPVANASLATMAARTLKGNATSGVATPTDIVTSQVPGTVTNDNAAAGNIGEILETNVPIGSPVAVTSGASKSVAALVLTAGDWDVWGVIGTIPAAGTTTAGMQAAIGTAVDTLPTSPNGGAFNLFGAAAAANQSLVLPTGTMRVSTAGVTLQLVINVGFAVNTMGAYGYIGARRAR